MKESTSTWMVSLNGNNWLIWKVKMEYLLYLRDLRMPIEVDKKIATMSDEDWIKSDKKATACIKQWLDDIVFHYVVIETKASTLWNKLQSL